MAAGLRLVAGPSGALFTPKQLRDQCRSIEDLDDVLAVIADDAIEKVERDTGRQLLAATWEQFEDRFYRLGQPVPNCGTRYRQGIVGMPAQRIDIDGRIKLGRAPVQSINSVSYLGTDNSWHTVAAGDYVLIAGVEPCLVVPAQGKSWPTDIAPLPASVRIEFVAGYANAALVPRPLKRAITMLAAHWLEHPEAAGAGMVVTPLGYDDITADWAYAWGF